MEFIQIPKERSTRAIGKTTSSMGKGWKYGMKDHSMRECMSWERKRDLENTFGRMGRFMKANGWTIEYMAKEFTCGKMEGSIMENGLTMIWKE